MNKQDFINELRSRLSGLPQEDIEERVGFYCEMIDDRVEDGLSEEEAVAQIGGADEAASQIIAEIPLSKLVKEKVKSKRKLKAWEIVLIAAGSPVWFSLLVAFAAVFIALYISLWAVIASLWSVMGAFAVSAVACIAGAAVLAVQGAGNMAFCSIGAALVLAGLAIFLFFGCLGATKGTAKLTKKIALGIKSLFIRKDDKNE